MAFLSPEPVTIYLSSPEMSQLSTDEDSFDCVEKWEEIKRKFISFIVEWWKSSNKVDSPEKLMRHMVFAKHSINYLCLLTQTTCHMMQIWDSGHSFRVNVIDICLVLWRAVLRHLNFPYQRLTIHLLMLWMENRFK